MNEPRQLSLTRASEIKPRRRRSSWGPWHLDHRQAELWTDAGGYRYGIDLLECTNSAEVADWIFQINAKTWGSDDGTHGEIIAGLVNALHDILNPQATLCSFGQDSRLTPERIRNLINGTDEDCGP